VLLSLLPVIILITRAILAASTDKVKSRHAEKKLAYEKMNTFDGSEKTTAEAVAFSLLLGDSV
jgi:hypothetical protein